MLTRLTMPLVPEATTTNFVKEMGITGDEGLLCAYIPLMVGMPQEVEYREGTRTFTLVSLDGRAIDMMPQDQKGVKWWMVKNAAKENKLEFPQELWYGPADEFSIDALPDMPQPEGTVLALRQYSRGPWIKLQDSLSKEKKEDTV